MKAIRILPIVAAAVLLSPLFAAAQSRPTVRPYIHEGGAGWHALAIDENGSQLFLAGYSEDRLALIQVVTTDGVAHRVRLAVDLAVATITTDGSVVEVAPLKPVEVFFIDMETTEVLRMDTIGAGATRQVPLTDFAAGRYLVLASDGSGAAALYTLVVP